MLTSLLLLVSLSAPATASCTPQMASDAIDAASAAKDDWNKFYKTFKDYSACDDGAIAEGFSDSAAQLLAKHWDQVGIFFTLAGDDPNFESFTLRHLDETDSAYDLSAAAINARDKCPAGKRTVCQAIWAQATSPESGGIAPIYIGVLENFDIPGPEMLSSVPHVRLAFRKDESDWIPMIADTPKGNALGGIPANYPEAVKWTVVFDGRSLGNIESRNPKTWDAYGDVGVQVIASDPQGIPRTMTDAKDFSSTFDASARPLLLVSRPNYHDPDGWKRTTPSAAEFAVALVEFRKHVPQKEHCDVPEEKPSSMVDYSDGEVKVVKAYRSNKGELLLGVQLDSGSDTCQWFDDAHYYDYWFVLGKDRSIRFLGSQLTPMDAADVDGSGSSTWIFKTFRGEDEDGYELFYLDFSKKAYFSWTWH